MSLPFSRGTVCLEHGYVLQVLGVTESKHDRTKKLMKIVDRSYSDCTLPSLGHCPHGAFFRWTLVTICPGFTLGPPLSPHGHTHSIKFMKYLMDGSFWPYIPPMGMPVVDVDDVAAAHCLALAKEEARGRWGASGSGKPLIACLAVDCVVPDGTPMAQRVTRAGRSVPCIPAVFKRSGLSEVSLVFLQEPPCFGNLCESRCYCFC